MAPRLPEPWIYIPAAPITYITSGGRRLAQVNFDPIPQKTVNVAVGMFITGLGPGTGWRNVFQSIRVEGREQVRGPGALAALVAGELRITGPQTGAGVVPEPPTQNGAPFWPGQTLMLYTRRCVGGFPIAGSEQTRIIIENLTLNPDDDITQLGFYMMELPLTEAEKDDPMQRRWNSLYQGVDAITFLSHRVDYSAAGLVNFDDPQVINTWHDLQQRRVGFRLAAVDTLVAGVTVANVNESALRQILVNTRSDRTRQTSTQMVTASLWGGFAGLDVSELSPVDYKANGEDRDVLTITAPGTAVGDQRSLFGVTLLSGILEREYFGRVAGEPM